MYESLKAAVGLLALGLPPGARRYFVCPLCQAEHERSLSVLRTETGVVYKCWRASCSLRSGFIPSTPYLGYRPETIFAPRPFKEPTELLPEPIADWLKTKYYLTDEEVANNGLQYAPETNRLVFPIRNGGGFDLGTQAKRLPVIIPHTSVYPGNKSSNYFIAPGPYLYFPSKVLDTSTLVLVEDPLSAIRCARLGNAGAILGSQLSDRLVAEIRRWWRGTRVIMALDPDAYAKSLEHKQKYKLWFGTFEVRCLSNDPKDLPHEQLIEELAL
jgi:hypothetical protein